MHLSRFFLESGIKNLHQLNSIIIIDIHKTNLIIHQQNKPLLFKS